MMSRGFDESTCSSSMEQSSTFDLSPAWTDSRLNFRVMTVEDERRPCLWACERYRERDPRRGPPPGGGHVVINELLDACSQSLVAGDLDRQQRLDVIKVQL